MTEQMTPECMRLFNEITKLQGQQGQLLTTQSETLTEIKTLVANHYVQLTNDVSIIKDKIAPISEMKEDIGQVKADVAPLSWVKWVTLVIGGVLIAQAVANIFT